MVFNLLVFTNPSENLLKTLDLLGRKTHIHIGIHIPFYGIHRLLKP